MPDIKIEVVFTGICAFVKSGNGIAAVMPDVRSHHHHPHVPWMKLFRGGKLELTTIFGHNGSLEIDAMPAGRVKLKGPDTSDKIPTTNKNERSTRWVARFPQIEPSPKLKQPYTAVGHPKEVALWVDVPSGDLDARYVAGCAWETRSKNDPTPKTDHALAQEVSVTNDVKNIDEFTITHHGLAFDSRGGLVTTDTVYRVSVGTATSFEIMIGHTTAVDIDAMGTPVSPDEHFSLYYDLLDKVVVEDDRRLPHNKNCVFVARIGGANCPPVFMYDAPVDVGP